MTVSARREEVTAFWETCRASLPAEQATRLSDEPDAWAFGDGPAMADELAALVLAGRKTATCGLLWEYQDENEPLPEPGQLSVILSGAGRPICLIETIEVRVLPYQDVDAQFAYDEGEGDRSLDYWRAEHWKYFSRYLAEAGRQPALDMPLVCERFRVIYQPSDTSE